MTSVHTNTPSVRAVSILRDINEATHKTHDSVSTGYRVKKAQDDAAYWSVATTMRSDTKAISSVQDALAFGAALTDTAYNGLDETTMVLDKIKAKLVMAHEAGVDKVKINTELVELKAHLFSIAEASVFSGQNLLYREGGSDPDVVSMVGSFKRESDRSVSIDTLDFDRTTSTLFDTSDAQKGLLTRANTITQPSGAVVDYYLVEGKTNVTGTEIEVDNSTSTDAIDGMISVVDKMMQDITDTATVLGAMQSRIDMQSEFATDMIDTIEKGVGRLVDTKMDETSARLRSLQVQQKLGIETLFIANASVDSFLPLLR